MKLVIMTKSTFFVEEDKILSALFDEGMDILHLNKTDTSPLYYERLLSLLPDKLRKKTIVHQHFELKNEYQLAGIHLQQLSTPIPNNYHGKITRSCSDFRLLKETRKKPTMFCWRIYSTALRIPPKRLHSICYKLSKLPETD